jgi:CysZ protein
LFSAISKTLGQMNDPAIRRVMGKTLGLAILGYVLFVVLVYLLINWLAGFEGWLQNLAEFGGVISAIVVAWFLFPSIAAAIAGIFADEVIDAVEAKHYPQLPPGKPVPIMAAVLDGLKLAAIAVVANLLALPFLLVFPIYVLITCWAGSISRWWRSGAWTGRRRTNCIAGITEPLPSPVS